ncbi:MAG TPA: SDR family oxidoreductase [Candidatus Dormibacteraeota bacterium]|nr:SDR family oxidoreductase [Candidatus Dormibacteraeota bacterium]
MRKLESYAGLNAVVTGASSGIGETLARRLATAGARVALVARRAERLEALAAQITAAGGQALVVPCDVADRGASEAAARLVLERFGSVELLVNNAGYGHHRRFLDWDVDDIERMMQVNYFGAVYWTKALLPQMVARERGWLVFVASVAGKLGVPEESAYAASKFAMVGLAEALSYEVEDAGVHVLTVCPGTIRTEFFDEEALRRMPPVSRRMMVDVEPMVEAIIDALAKGRRELTFPRFIATGYIVRALAPGIMRRNTRKQTLDALAKEGR